MSPINTNYSENDIMRMQQDAMRRVQEMQRRARINLNDTIPAPAQPGRTNGQTQNHGGNNPPQNQSTHQPRPQQTQQTQQTQQPQNQSPGHSHTQPSPGNNEHSSSPLGNLTDLPKKAGSLLSGVFDALGLNSEQLLILAVLFVLINEKADKTVILALCYLLF